MFDINHIAKLARISLSGEEEKKFGKDLADILEFIKKLEEVDVSGIEPTAQATGLINVFRVDEPQRSDEATRRKIIANAPQTKDGHIKVKMVFE